MTFSETVKAYRLELLGLLLVFMAVYHRIIPDMIRDWSRDENYSHGFLVPFIAVFLGYMRRSTLLAAHVRPSNAGLAVMVSGLCMLGLGWLGTEYFTMRASLVIILAGATLFLFGREVLAVLLVPLCYLLLMIPIPAVLYDAAAFPLKLLVTRVSVACMKALGVIVMQEGNILMFPSITLEVADACSGLRSIMSLLALGAAYAFVLHSRARDRVILILSTLPIAIVANCLRVVGTGILAQYFGPAVAEGFFHEFAGLFVFVGAVVLFSVLGSFLKRWS